MKKFIAIVTTLMLAVSACACGQETRVGVHVDEVECGKYYRVPDLVGAEATKVSVKSPRNKNVRVSAGSFQMAEEGVYTITYEYEGGSKEIKVKATSDVSAPYLTSDLSVSVSEQQGVRYLVASANMEDPAGIDYTEANGKPASFDYRFYYEDETVELEKTGDMQAKADRAGTYTVVLPAKDTKGNYVEYTKTIVVTDKFVDTTLADGMIADFDEEGYLQYISSTAAWGDITDKFDITDEYPTSDGSGNKVLYARSNGRYSPHYLMKYEFYEEIPLDEVKYVYMRYCTVKATGMNDAGTVDFASIPMMLYALPYSLNDGSTDSFLVNDPYMFTVQDGVWTTARIPVSYLITNRDTSLKGLKFATSCELYIDEIWYDNEEFVDDNKEANVLADFDEKGYLYQARPGNIGDAPGLDLMLSGYPDAEEGSGALKIYSTSWRTRSANVNIQLFDSVSVQEHPYVYFRIYFDGRIPGSLAMAPQLVFMWHKLTNFYDENIFDHTIDDYNASDYYETWKTVKIPSKVFAGGDSEGTFDVISVLVRGTVYIDKIWVD